MNNAELRLLRSAQQQLSLQLYARMLQAYLNKSIIDTAIVGNDDVSSLTECLTDYGFDFKTFYGPPFDLPYRPSKPVAELDPINHDLILIGAESEAEELSVFRELFEMFRAKGRPRSQLFLARFHRLALQTTFAKLQSVESVLNISKILALCNGLAVTSGGCIVECGAYRCGSSVLFGLFLETMSDDRKYYALDTFSGIPAATVEDGDSPWDAGMFVDTSLRFAKELIESHGLVQRVVPVAGLVQDTLPDILKTERSVSLAFIDTDQYIGTLESLKSVTPALNVNGLIFIDDYCCAGVQRAVKEFRRNRPDMRGFELTRNVFVLWRQIDDHFLSSALTRRLLS